MRLTRHKHRVQEEEFDEDEGIYDELNLDEEEEKFGLANDDGETDESEDESEGTSQVRYVVQVVFKFFQTCLHERQARKRITTMSFQANGKAVQ